MNDRREENRNGQDALEQERVYAPTHVGAGALNLRPFQKHGAPNADAAQPLEPEEEAETDGAEVAVPQCRPAAKPSTIPASAPAAAAMAGIFHFSGVISPPAVSSKSIYTFGVPFSTGAEKNFREQDEGQVRCPRRRG